MIQLKDIYENIVSDFKKDNINITKNTLDKISTDIDIQNSNVIPLSVSKWTQIKGKYVFIVSVDDVVVAIYNKSKFDYNPSKLKVSDVEKDDYRCYEVVNNMGSILGKQKERREQRKGLKTASELDLNKLPSSRTYLNPSDWNPEINREYYKKLLAQNNLMKYSAKLDDAYDIIDNLITHRRADKTVGKRAVYTDWIQKITTKIQKVELILDAIHKDVSYDVDKLDKEMKALNNLCKQAQGLISTEDKSIARYGYEPFIPAKRPMR